MRFCFYIYFFFLSVVIAKAHTPYSWKDWYSYSAVKDIHIIDNTVIALTENGLFLYDIDKEALQKITKLQGLSSVGLTCMKYNHSTQKLLIGYYNGMLDIIEFPSLTIRSVPTIVNQPLYGSKIINSIEFSHDTAFVATDFGLVTIDMNTYEFIHTAYLGTQGEYIGIKSISINDNKLYAGSTQGIYSVMLSENISDGSLWKKLPIFPNSAIKSLLYAHDALYVCPATATNTVDSVYTYSHNSLQLLCTPPHISSITRIADTVVVIGHSSLFFYNSSGIKVKEILRNTDENMTNFSSVAFHKGAYWIGSMATGIYKENSAERIYPAGPLDNLIADVFVLHKNVHIVSGSARAYKYAMYNMRVGNSWYGHINWGLQNSTVVYASDWWQSYFYGTIGYGLVQATQAWKADTLYNKYNSTIQNVYDDDSPYERIVDIAEDAKHTIWCINTEVGKPLIAYDAKKNWHSFHFTGNKTPYYTRLAIDNANTLWIAGESTLVAYNPGDNVASTADDKVAYIPLSDAEGNIANRSTSIAIDLNGHIWVGTAQGIARHTAPYSVFDGNTSLARIKIEIDGEVGYLLSSEYITCITIDGANRKWVGTQNSGVFLLSADGTKQLAHYTIQNSPLPSNAINAIAIEHTEGEVLFATDRGLISFYSDATIGAERMNSIKIFPNPVRPDYAGNIYIQGTTAQAIVKITTMAHELVFQTIAQGGTAVWDGTNLSGTLVATGVYMVYISSPDGTHTAVSKLAVVR